jgi:ABC-2 type transport system permease protein
MESVGSFGKMAFDFLLIYGTLGIVCVAVWYLLRFLMPPLTYAVFKRNTISYFTNPIGYLFITAFTAIGSYFAFSFEDRFFAANMCDLSQLSAYFPYLLVLFIPAITMSTWAEERKNGTEELLLTLPGTDVQIVFGKYLAALAIYSVALAFLGLQYFVLSSLGEPDGGLLAATFLGYWLIGAALIATGMVASLLTSNTTIAFIIGVLFCLALVSLYNIGAAFTGVYDVRYFLDQAGIVNQFEPFSRGLVLVHGILYFVGITAVMLYLNVVLLSRRHWEGGADAAGHWLNYLVRAASLAVIVIGIVILSMRSAQQYFLDFTEEDLHQLSEDTNKIVQQIDPKRPVVIEAYISPNPPRGYERHRRDLVDALERIAAIGGDRVIVDIVNTEPFTQAARDAEAVYNIKAQPVPVREDSRQSVEQIYMGVGVRCGSNEKVIPFFYPSIPVEYELTRTIRSVSQVSRVKIGVLTTDANLFGEFNFQMMQPGQDWMIITELKQQYDVVRVSPDTPVPADIKVLIVPMASSLSDPQLDGLIEYIRAGRPALILDDPLPLVNYRLAALRPRDPKQPPMMGMPQQPPMPKGELARLTRLLNLRFDAANIIWQQWNPLPMLPDLPPEYAFIGPGSGNAAAFNPDNVIVSGMQMLLTMYPGSLQPLGGDGPTFEPLLTTGKQTGTTPWNKVLNEEFLGVTLNERPPRARTGRQYVLAAQIKGKLTGMIPATQDSPASGKKSGGGDDTAAPEKAPPAATEEAKDINVIFIADLDLISDQMFAIRQQATDETLKFDNVPFILNCVDALAGDEGFVALRKKRAKRRTLEAIEKQIEGSEDYQQSKIEEAQTEAEKAIADAQKKLADEVEKIDKDTSVPPHLREQKKNLAQSYWQNQFNQQKEKIERELNDRIKTLKEETAKERREQESRVKWLALLLPPIPALLIGLVVFFFRASGEREGVNPNRLV